METVHKFDYHEIEKMLERYVLEKTMDSMLENKKVGASAPYGDYVVKIKDIPDKETEVEADGSDS